MTMVLTSFAAYVWWAYGISLAALAATAFVTLWQWRQARRLLAHLKDSETNI
jgi:heme exporter protein CcmD